MSTLGSHRLVVVMYHYVRDLPRSRFPRIKGMMLDDFRNQVDELPKAYEMATMESAWEFLQGRYEPQKDLCLLTFDDGLREHYAEVTPILAERGVQGVFFLISGCIENQKVAAVHKNHFLMAAMEFEDYRGAVEKRLRESPLIPSLNVSAERARATYRWDTQEVAEFKYLLNFCVSETARNQVLDELFQDSFRDEAAFARELYVTWDEAIEMQTAGMSLGGHSHSHRALGKMDEAEQRLDLEQCSELLRARVGPQTLWPFSYPYGKPGDAFTDQTVRELQRLKFDCSFATVVGSNRPGQDGFSIRRIDTKDVMIKTGESSLSLTS